MLNKENICPPKKQGILYTIATGKNNGVYLPKDISYQNHKSLKLLTKQSQQSHKSYVETLKLIQKQRETQLKMNANMIQVESFSQNYDFSIKHVVNLKSNLLECGQASKSLKMELQKLKQKITTQNTQLYEAALPALKSLKQKVKANKEQQMANYSKMHRQLEKVEQCFTVVSNGVKQTQRKLEYGEGNFKGRAIQ